MLDQYGLVLRHSQGGTLRIGRTDEFRGRYVCRRDTVFFKINDIVRTARDAGPSIAEGFDHRIALLT